MNLWEGVRLALSQIWTQKLKSFFSLAGVIIGVMFLIVVVSVVEGLDRYIKEDFSEQLYGVNTVTVRRRPSVQINPDREQRRAWARRPELTYDDLEAIRERLRVPAAVGAHSDVSGQLRADNGRQVENVRISGATPEVLAVRNLRVEHGRAFSRQESERGVPVVVLGTSTAEALFPGVDPLGHTVRIGAVPFRVVGVLEEQGSVLGVSLDNRAVAPARSAVQRLTNPRGVVDEILVKTDDPARLQDAIYELEAIMRIRHQLRPTRENDFELETAEESLSFWNRISTILFTALPGLVGISLVVGGIVIMNIMLVSVMERTREIGVRKAIGARRRDILVQVLIEAGTLSAVGALVGIAVGVGLAALVRALSPLPVSVALRWIALGVALGVTVGIVAGVYPAARASRLDPVDALRYE